MTWPQPYPINYRWLNPHPVHVTPNNLIPATKQLDPCHQTTWPHPHPTMRNVTPRPHVYAYDSSQPTRHLYEVKRCCRSSMSEAFLRFESRVSRIWLLLGTHACTAWPINSPTHYHFFLDAGALLVLIDDGVSYSVDIHMNTVKNTLNCADHNKLLVKWCNL
jgi:hypothetical protein